VGHLKQEPFHLPCEPTRSTLSLSLVGHTDELLVVWMLAVPTTLGWRW
jgi:hypothetical protein